MFDDLIVGTFFTGALLLGAAESQVGRLTRGDRAGADMARAVAMTMHQPKAAPHAAPIATRDPVARQIITEMRAAKARGDAGYVVPRVDVSNEGARAITNEVRKAAGPAAAAQFEAKIKRKGIVSSLWGQ